MARAQALDEHHDNPLVDQQRERLVIAPNIKDEQPKHYSSFRLHGSDGSVAMEVEDEISPLMVQASTPRRVKKFLKIRTPHHTKLVVKDRKYEYTELCKIFLGSIGEKAYMTSVGIAVTLQLWGHAAVFALGMAQFLSISNSFEEDYKLYVVIFGSLVIPLSCLELEEQVEFQIVLSFCRFLVIYLMIQTVLCASWDSSGHVYFTLFPDANAQPSKMVDFSGFYEMSSVLVYTAMFHNGIPVLAEPVADRTKLSSIFLYSILVVCGACWLLGSVVALYFGADIEQSANLNWDSYVGGTGYANENDVWVNVAFWAVATARFIVLFPVANVISAFPLNAIVLGNNYLIGACGASAEVSTHKRTLSVDIHRMFRK